MTQDEIELHQLKMLMDYTKFHIGLYAALITASVALITLGLKSDDAAMLVYRGPMEATAVLLVLAGACAGMVAAPIPNATKFHVYWNNGARLFGICVPFLKVRRVAVAEHVFFWLAVANVLVALLTEGAYFGGRDLLERILG